MDLSMFSFLDMVGFLILFSALMRQRFQVFDMLEKQLLTTRFESCSVDPPSGELCYFGHRGIRVIWASHTLLFWTGLQWRIVWAIIFSINSLPNVSPKLYILSNKIPSLRRSVFQKLTVPFRYSVTRVKKMIMFWSMKFSCSTWSMGTLDVRWTHLRIFCKYSTFHFCATKLRDRKSVV